GFTQPGFTQPGFTQPGFTQPGFTQPGFVQSGPAVSCEPSYSFPQAVTPPSFVPGAGAMPLNGSIGQVSGESYPGDAGVSPIPSTDPLLTNPPGYGYGNTAPLVGDEPTDSTPVPQPRIESRRFETQPDDLSPFASPSESDQSEIPLLNDGREDSLMPPADGSDPSTDENDSSGPAIELNPPVTNLFNKGERFTRTGTPPSLEFEDRPSNAGDVPEASTYSRLRPIGSPETESLRRAPVDDLQPPPLPPAKQSRDPELPRGFDQANQAGDAGVRLAVPVRNATMRQRNIQPVAAWEPVKQPSSSYTRGERGLANPPVKPRDTGVWKPADR
ncbi:MAG: hypothetical protein AAFV88_18975, partial [Planctomycetota bacterium]